MGLFKAAKDAIGSTLGDEWKEAIRCDEMTDEMLMVRKTTPTGVITNGSIIVVAPGQCAIIYDNGRVIDATAEDGVYKFDSSSSPSFFAGQFKESFKEMWERFTFNGATSKQQAVFFFNIKEIMNNKFGTSTPIPFQDWSHPIPNRMTNSMSPLSVKVRCYGTYSFRMINPALFMSELAGTVDVYYKSNVVDQMRSEVMAAFQNVLNELGNSANRVPVLEMPSQTDEIKEMMDKAVYDEAIRKRGLKLVSFAVESVTLDNASEDKIDNYEFSSNTYMQQGRMTEAYANAIESAAKNTSGVGNGFMGIGIANMGTGGMMSGNMTNVMQNFNAQGCTQTYDPYASNAQNVPQTNVTYENNVQNQTNITNESDNENVSQEPNVSEVQHQNDTINTENQQQSVQPQYNSEVNQSQPINSPMDNQYNQPIGNESIKQEEMPNNNEPIVQEQPIYNELNVNNEQNIQNETIHQTNEIQNNQSNTNSVDNSTFKMCRRCGNINPADSLFCNKCGNQL